MQTTRRSQVRTPRKDRMWVVSTSASTILAAGVGTAGAVTSIGNAFESQSGRNLRGVTISTIYLKGFATEQTQAATPVPFQLGLGLMIAPEGMDSIDFPSILTGGGDYFLRDVREVHETGDATIPRFLLPSQAGDNVGGIYNIHNKSMRKINRQTDQVFIVFQKDTVTEFDVNLFISLTVLYLMPS